MNFDAIAKSDKKRKHKVALGATVLSMALNIVLAVGKLVCGAIFGAISVLADGFNNLSDCGGNIITLIGVRVAAMPADKEHPFGHARGEYIAAMALSFLIILLGFELFVQSVESIVAGSGSEFSVISVVVLSVSIAVKTSMFFYNRHLGKKYSSEVLSATSIDSLGDALASSVVLVSLIIMKFTAFDPDGYVGCLVAVVIALSGFKVLRSTASEQLGKRPDKSVSEAIRRKLLSYDGIYGVHALTVHNYINKLYASVHAEIDADTTFLAAHELADTIEKDFAENTDVILTIHLDPVILHDDQTLELRSAVEKIISKYPSYVIHDFREVQGKTPKLIFELSVPLDTEASDKEIIRSVTYDLYGEFGSKYSWYISVDREI